MDTRTKRASALGVGRPWYRTKNPDATKPESWRQATGNFYAGNALTPPLGISLTANRIIPLTVELYVRTQEEFPDLNMVGVKDSEFIIKFTCNNKDATSPYSVAASDLSNTDKQEMVFTSPSGEIIIRKTTFFTDGTDGIVFFVCQLNDMNVAGKWQVKVRITEGVLEINYPNVPFTVYP